MAPPTELIALARTIAEKHSLDPALVCAVIEQESAWDANAIRYEPAFRTRYVAPLGLPATEEVARSISWGLMQVMGQVAREHGFTGKFLSSLCDPAAGLEAGCAVLVSKFTAAAAAQAQAQPGATSPNTQATTSRALQLWNGGGNLNYASEVLARLANYK
jgi:soluble lytic murein transglycosylase-like protein